MRNLSAWLLTALCAAAAAPGSALGAWARPAHDLVVLRAYPSADAAALALAYRGETLLVTAAAAARGGTGVWQHVSRDGREGWLASSDVRPALAPASRWRPCASRPVGSHTRGWLLCGRRLPAQGTGYRTWDFPLSRSPSRPGRRWGTSKLVAQVQWIARRWQARHPLGARLLVGDLSRPSGGPFGRRYGPPGHASHQNGLDVDIYYPRVDGLEREAFRPSQVDRLRARELVALIARSHPQVIFVGCRVGLPARGRARHLCIAHENHVHVRYRR